MNFPGVIAGDEEMLARIAVAGGLRVDGHSPGVSGRLLDAYLAAGVESDHEARRSPRPKRSGARGCGCSCARGRPARTWWTLAPSVVAHGTDQAAFCTDDREPDTLRRLGHVNDCARLAVANGISEIEAILLASTNPARYHGFDGSAASAPATRPTSSPSRRSGPGCPIASGRRAGRRDRRRVDRPGAVPAAPVPDLLRDTVNIGALPGADALVLPVPLGSHVRAVGVESHSLTTRADRARGRARRRPGPRRRRRAPPRDRPGRPRIRHRLRPAARGDRLDRRPRRAQPRRRRPLRGGHAQSRSPGWPRSAAASWRCSTAPSWPRCRCRWPG